MSIKNNIFVNSIVLIGVYMLFSFLFAKQFDSTSGIMYYIVASGIICPIYIIAFKDQLKLKRILAITMLLFIEYILINCFILLNSTLGIVVILYKWRSILFSGLILATSFVIIGIMSYYLGKVKRVLPIVLVLLAMTTVAINYRTDYIKDIIYTIVKYSDSSPITEGNNIYYFSTKFKPGKEFASGTTTVSIYKFNTENQKREKLVDLPADTNQFSVENIGFYNKDIILSTGDMLYKFNLNTKVLSKIASGRYYDISYKGDYVYYISQSADNTKFEIHSVNINTNENKIIYENEYIKEGIVDVRHNKIVECTDNYLVYGLLDYRNELVLELYKLDLKSLKREKIKTVVADDSMSATSIGDKIYININDEDNNLHEIDLKDNRERIVYLKDSINKLLKTDKYIITESYGSYYEKISISDFDNAERINLENALNNVQAFVNSKGELIYLTNNKEIVKINIDNGEKKIIEDNVGEYKVFKDGTISYSKDDKIKLIK